MVDDTERQDKIRNRIDFNDEILALLNTPEAKSFLSKNPSILVSTPKILPFYP